MTATGILVVEDERIIALGIEEQLKSMGYAVVGMASSGQEAVRKAVELHPDLILMDISLGGGIDGVEAAALIHQKLDVPIVYLTANSDSATFRRAKLTDPFGYVLKPYEEKELQTAIEIGLYRYKIEWRLRENEQWLAATLSSIGDGVIATDEQARVRSMNPLAQNLTGWKISDAIGHELQDIFQIVNEGDRQPVVNPVHEALMKGEPAKLAPNTLLIDKCGVERSIDDMASPIRDVNGKVTGAVLVFRDITERRRLEDHLRQAQKMEAIGRLAGGIAHDFNNIMCVIIGFTELLLADGILAAPMTAGARADAMQNIHDAAQRAAALTQQLMAFSRKQVLVPRVLNLNDILRDIGMMVKRLIGTNIEFASEPAPDLGHVKADPTQIGQVIMNLAGNARDAMPKGGLLVIGTMNFVLERKSPFRNPDMEPGEYVVLSVRDTGFGMSEEVLTHIFDPFFTTKGVGDGTGLGLATVYGIVKQSGGHIEVASKVGIGTTFQVFLPMLKEATTPAKSEEFHLSERGHETILLVEDDDLVRRMTTIMLVKSGYTVLEASDGLNAETLAEKYLQSIHLLITDLMMPNRCGREVAERLMDLKPGLRVLFMSGYSDDNSLLPEGESNSNFLQKPFSFVALTNKVREILDGH